MVKKVFVKRNEFPLHAKSLGAPLLAYILGLTEIEVERLLQEGAELDISRFEKIRVLDQIMLQAKQGRIYDHELSWNELVRLPDIRYQDGTIPFNKIRSDLVGEHSPRVIQDPVMKILGKYCEDSFPFCLLPPNTPDHVYGIHFPHFHKTPLSEQLFETILQDESLSKLFSTIGQNEMDTRGTYYSSLGESRSVSLASFPNSLLQSAHILMRINGAVSLTAFQDAMEQILGFLRKALNGQLVKVPAIFCFDGIGFPDGVEIAIKESILQGISKNVLQILPRHGRPPEGPNQRSFGSIYKTEVDFQIHLVPSDAPERVTGETWPIQIAKHVIDRNAMDKISLILALASDKTPAISARQTSWVVANPLSFTSASWSNKSNGITERVFLSNEQVNSVRQWAKIIDAVNDKQIEVAIRRYLTAMVEREDIADSLVDAVIGLENLFGDRFEISLSIATCVSKLLEKSNVESRKEIFTDVKKIYDARSAVIHGSKKRLEKLDLPTLRGKAVEYLSNCLRILYKERSDLIPLSSADRVKEIILDISN